MNTINLIPFIARKYPDLKKTLRIANSKDSPEQFVRRSLTLGLYISVGLTVLAFFMFSRRLEIIQTAILLLIVFLASFFLSFNFVLLTPRGNIRRRQRDIDKDVLFAGRYLLVKIESGIPLYNSLIDASKGYGIAGKYFKEIVDEISTGVTLEDALENARQYTPSQKFKKILWQIVLSMKTGTDVSGALKNTLHSITADQIIEIKEYGQKLNSILLFYMVIACVVPSLGLTIFLIIASIAGLTVTGGIFFFLLFMFAVIQLSFVFIVKSVRPSVDL